MATVIGDVAQVSLAAFVGTVIMRNVWYYRLVDDGVGDPLSGLADVFQSTVLAAYAATQYGATQFTSVSIENIFSGDVYEDNTPTPAAGTRTPNTAPTATFVSAMILMTRENNRVRHGRKYVYLGDEADIASNFIATGTLALLTTLANTFDDLLVAGLVFDWQPVIVGRVLYTTPSGGEAYRLPASQAEMSDNYSNIVNARVVNRVTTMNSRKFWKGE